MSRYKYGAKRNTNSTNLHKKYNSYTFKYARNKSEYVAEAVSCLDDELKELDDLFVDLNSLSQNVLDKFNLIKDSVWNLKSLT